MNTAGIGKFVVGAVVAVLDEKATPLIKHPKAIGIGNTSRRACPRTLPGTQLGGFWTARRRGRNHLEMND
jgi:hypothetical protein